MADPVKMDSSGIAAVEPEFVERPEQGLAGKEADCGGT
jgi:hypothetical protein